MIEIVCATRLVEPEFWQRSALGMSLRRLAQDSRLVACVSFANRRGLPEIYNARIDAAQGPDVCVFVHDDVWIDDYFLGDRILQGLACYDVIGVAGNRRRIDKQPGWAFPDLGFAWDVAANLSGAVAHGKSPFAPVSVFGEAPAQCELLDGVFLAARKSVLATHHVRFDERFEFHFYDLDFCRCATRNGLRLGTWPICLTHQSGGAFGSDRWREKYRSYLDKWGD
jgi:GT2 family glycosyltransferase